MSPTLSIIVVLYNSADELEDCLISVAPALETGWAELILVDNASPDDSVAAATRVAPHARLISLDRNVGFAGGVNAALPEARGRYILLLNPDVTVPADGLGEVVAWMDEYPTLAAASPDIRSVDGQPETPARAAPSIWRTLLETSRAHKLLSPELRSAALLGSYWTGDDEITVGWVPGTAMFVRRAVIDEVGALSGSLFMYGEDIEWCWRMRRAGYRIGVCARTCFRHRSSRSAVRSWGERATDEAVVSGIHQATRLMYGSTHARFLAAANALSLGLEAAKRGELGRGGRHRPLARLWLKAAFSGRLTASHPHLRDGSGLLRRARSEADPLVSVCIPTFNGVEYVRAAVDSALAQTYQRLEIVICDDASDDGTFELLGAVDDPRVRLKRNPVRLGHAANRNKAIASSRGSLIKFLDQDDLLEPDCVAEMVSLFARDQSIGLVFCRRQIIGPSGARDDSSEWARFNGTLQSGPDEMSAISDGRDLLVAWLLSGSNRNWIGEPVTVMVSRDHLRLSGGFNPLVRQTLDSDLWYRLIAHARVGFIPRELVCYRHGHPAETQINLRTRRGWLDRLWTLELLSRDDAVSAACPELAGLLRQARREAWRTVAKLGIGAEGIRYPLLPYLDVMRYRGSRLTNPRRQLVPPVV